MINSDSLTKDSNNWGRFRKLTTSCIISLVIMLSFLSDANAESYRLVQAHETYYTIEFSGLNIGWWPYYTRVRVFTNNSAGTYVEKTITTGGTYTMDIPYKGNAGTNANKVYTTAIVYLAAYGPFFRFNFTAPLLNDPGSVTATSDELNQVVLNWTKGTDYADGDVQYYVFKGGTRIATVPGNQLTYTRTGLANGEQDDYYIQTSLKGTNRVSHKVKATGQAFTFNLTASTDLNNVELEWVPNPDHMPNGYIIEREGSEIANLSKSAKKYIDDAPGVIPGVYYNYKIFSDDHPTVADFAVGRKAPNGKIEGYIKTPLNIAVGGVALKAVRQNVSDTVKYEYETVSSGEDGWYSLNNLYYGTDGAEYKVFPMLEGHMFDPDTLTRPLDNNSPTQSEVNFTDTTSLSVSGIVLQNSCPVADVSIMALGESLPYITRADGTYDLVVSQPGVYTITASKAGHEFEESYQDIEILEDLYDINFTDTSTVLVTGSFTASCNEVIGTAEIRFFTDGACLDTTITTDASGNFQLYLPISTYNVEVLDFISNDEGVLPSSDVLNYFNDTSTLNLDEIIVNDSAQYTMIYRLPPTLTVNFLGELETCDQNNMILEQGKTYPVIINVDEIFKGNQCAVDNGFIVVEQELTSDQMEIDTIHFSGDIDTVYLTAGIPNIVAPYLNTFRATAHVGKYISNVVEEDVLIVGHKPHTATFSTVSPNIPFLILHDPPGDGSFSSFEESTTFTSTFSLSGSVEISAGINAEVKAGLKLLKGQFVYSETEFALTISKSFGLSMGLNSESTWDTEFTVAKGYTTSSDDGIVGEGGDIYVGGAMNIIYAVTDVIEYDHEACEVKKYQTLAVEPDGFATTFIYTENHIQEILIPSLERIRELSPVDDRLKYDKEIDAWEQVVENNHNNIENAIFQENISFSGGSEFTSTVSGSSTFTQTISTTLTIEDRTEVSVEFEESGSGATIGAEFGVKIETGISGGGSVSNATSTSYTLTDDDEGDYQSVDILIDPVYGTPVFKSVAGTSSCPWEPGTQPREGVQLRSNKNFEFVEDPAGKAVFELQLANTSESDEDNTYNLVFDAASNPYGALITIGGSPVIGNVPTQYPIPAGESVIATVTVQKGPSTNQFDNLRFILESDCDGNISDEVLLSAEFASSCGDITLTPEIPQPLLTSETGDEVMFEVSDYTKENLTSITIERRTQYTNWETIHILAGDDINENSTDVAVSFANVPDDTYVIRAKANCSETSVLSESTDVIADRQAPVATMLNPLDLGTLEFGDVIYALFNENIQAVSASDISVRNQSTATDIDFQYGVTLNKLILLPDHMQINDGDTLIITVTNVKDYYGNSTLLSNLKATNADDTGPSWKFVVPDVESVFGDSQMDVDNDGVMDVNDICRFTYNPLQEDMDNDGKGDACDDDIDGDEILNEVDKCPFTKNVDQLDTDNDGVGDICDDDLDGDNIPNESDNCSYAANGEQNDLDLDGIGDACDDDIDGDTYDNAVDNCPTTANPDQTDSDQDGIGDACETTGIDNHAISNKAFRVYPNPFNSQFMFEMDIEQASMVKLEFCNMMGQVLQVIVNERLEPGHVTRKIETTQLPDGVYVIRLTMDKSSYSERVVKMD